MIIPSNEIMNADINFSTLNGFPFLAALNRSSCNGCLDVGSFGGSIQPTCLIVGQSCKSTANSDMSSYGLHVDHRI